MRVWHIDRSNKEIGRRHTLPEEETTVPTYERLDVQSMSDWRFSSLPLRNHAQGGARDLIS